MQPWSDSREWKPATVIRHHHTPRSYVVKADDGRNYRRNRQHLQVCPAPGPRSLDAEQSLDESARHSLPGDQTEQPAPPVSPAIPPLRQHHSPEPPKGENSEAYVTQVADKYSNQNGWTSKTKSETKNFFILFYFLFLKGKGCDINT